LAEIITIIPVVANSTRTGNSNRRDPVLLVVAYTQRIVAAEPISTSAFVNRAKASLNEHPVEPDEPVTPAESAMAKTRISTPIASQETSRARPSPRHTPRISKCHRSGGKDHLRQMPARGQ